MHDHKLIPCPFDIESLADPVGLTAYVCMIEVLLLLLAQNLGEGRPLPACPPASSERLRGEGGRVAAIATHPPPEVGLRLAGG